MMKRYHQYRSYGHGRFVAMTLAPPPEIILIAAAIAAGLVIAGAFSS